MFFLSDEKCLTKSDPKNPIFVSFVKPAHFFKSDLNYGYDDEQK